MSLSAEIDKCYAAGWTDGLPVVPPYRNLVDTMRDAMGWKSNERVAEFKAQRLEIFADHIAAAAVMSGCRPEYGPVLGALTEALFSPEFNLSGAEVTTGGASICAVVSGPIVDRLGFANGANALGGTNERINATIGRFGNMVRHFCGRGGGVLEAHGTVGHPGRLSFLIAERTDRHWPPFHTQSGLAADVSAVSVISSEGPNSVNNHYGNTPEVILDTIADCLGHSGQTNYYWHNGVYVIVVGPGHADTIARTYSREEARDYLYIKARRPTDDLTRLGRIPSEPRAKSRVVSGTMRSPVRSKQKLFLLEAGADGGQFSAVVPGWVGCYEVVSRIIKE